MHPGERVSKQRRIAARTGTPRLSPRARVSCRLEQGLQTRLAARSLILEGPASHQSALTRSSGWREGGPLTWPSTDEIEIGLARRWVTMFLTESDERCFRFAFSRAHGTETKCTVLLIF